MDWNGKRLTGERRLDKLHQTTEINLKGQANYSKSLAWLLLLLAVFWIAPAHGKKLYKWLDADGRLHVTETEPPDQADIQDIIEYEPSVAPDKTPADSAQRPGGGISAVEEEKRMQRCGLVFEARKIADRANSVFRSAEERAKQNRQEAADLRERVGYDDEDLDDFKDDIRRLEEKTRWAESYARLAKLQADTAELQVKITELIIDEDCRRRF